MFVSRLLPSTCSTPCTQIEYVRPLRKPRDVFRASAPSARSYFDNILGKDPKIEAVRKQIIQAAPHKIPVLILGETGTGKSMVAAALHERSPRAKHSFLTVDMNTLHEGLIGSELFGHEKGAFTGASTAHKGIFERANNGTVFLDEIGDMPLGLQGELLRVLEEGRFRPVGGADEKSIDVQVIASTNQHLSDLVGKGIFRADLYYRLLGVQITLPPLRERRSDILELADFYLERFRSEQKRPHLVFSAPVRNLFEQYAWPGNVRELMMVVRSAALFCDAGDHEIQEKHLFGRLNAVEPAPSTPAANALPRIETYEQLQDFLSAQIAILVAQGDIVSFHDFRLLLGKLIHHYLQEVVKFHDGNVTEAARPLQMERSLIYQRFRRGVKPFKAGEGDESAP